MNAHTNSKNMVGEIVQPNSLPLRHAAYALVVPTTGQHKGLILTGVARERRGKLSGQYVFPGGGLEPHEIKHNEKEYALDEIEGYRKAALREYGEEGNKSKKDASSEIILQRQEPIANFTMEAYFGDIKAKLFLADLANPYLLPEPSDEISAWYFFTLDKLLNDDKTSIGIKQAFAEIDFSKIPLR